MLKRAEVLYKLISCFNALDIKIILDEDQENRFDEKKDSGILVESYSQRFDEEYGN